MDALVYGWVQDTLYEHGAPHSVLELGSFNVNGSVKGLFRAEGAAYYGVDLRPGPDVDEVADAADFAPAPGRFDAVLCTSLLEHCPYPGRVVANAGRILPQGGRLYLTTPVDNYPAHGVDGGRVGGEHYANPTPEDVLAWLTEAGFGRSVVTLRGEQMLVYAIKEDGG